MKTGYAGLVLAGGQGRRLKGADKGLLTLNDGPTFAQQLLARLKPYTQEIWLSCNRHQNAYRQWAHCLNDDRWHQAGPLAGIERALRACNFSHLIVLPCDTPFITATLIHALWVKSHLYPDAIIATRCDTHMHPLHAVIPLSMYSSLVDFLNRGERSVMAWYAHKSIYWLNWPHPEELLNINTHLQLNQACQRVPGHPGIQAYPQNCLEEQTPVIITGGQ